MSGQAVEAMPIDDPESYRVLSALLPTPMAGRRSMITIQAESTVSPHVGRDESPDPCWPSGPPIETEWKSTLENLRVENARARTIRPGFALSVPYIVLPKADIMASFSRDVLDGSKRFYERFPDSDGFAAVSAVGFDPDRTKAIVYFSHHYAALGGDYAYHLLRKLEGQWQEARVPGVNVCQVWS